MVHVSRYITRLAYLNEISLRGITKLFDIRQIPLERKLIGFVGRLENEKGLQILQALVDKRESYKRTAEELRQANRDWVWLYQDQGPRLPKRPMRNFDTPQRSAADGSFGSACERCSRRHDFSRTQTKSWGSTKGNVGQSYCPIFDEGATGRQQFGERDQPRRPDDSLINSIVEALKAIPVYTDEQRTKLAAKAESAGFSDTKMYKEYRRIYDEAVADVGKY
jgi:hypothetical protein